MDGSTTFRSCHQILGIGREATGDEVAVAYLRTASRDHPAAGGAGDPGARARFREAAEAWGVLSDGRIASCRGDDGDARARAVYEETLAWRAGALAASGLRGASVRDALLRDGCPAVLAGPAAEAATGAAAGASATWSTGGATAQAEASEWIAPAPGPAPASTRAPAPVPSPDRPSTPPSIPPSIPSSSPSASPRRAVDAVPVLAAAKAAAAAINEADRRAALAAAFGREVGESLAGIGRATDDAAARLESAAALAPPAPADPTRATGRPGDADVVRASLARASGVPAAGRDGSRGPAPRGVAPAVADDADEDPDPFPDLDARLEERVAAAVADLAMLAAACVAPAMLVGRLLDWTPLAVERLALAACLVGAAAWFVHGERRWGATPGKRLLGLSVERLDRGPLDARTAWLRHGLRTMSLLLGGIGFATAAITERRQALHDLLTDTRVRSRGLQRPELVWTLCAAPPVLGLLALGVARFG